MSTEFLSTPKDLFLKDFSQKFSDKQSIIDAIFYHEFAHIISTHHFPQISNIYSQLNNNKLQQSPLYQVIRNVEENFSDAYAALLHKEKHNAFDIYHYVASRNSTNSKKSKNFDFNINSLGSSFNQVNNISLTSELIDDVCKKLYSISIISVLEVLEKTISSNSEFKQKLINNLELLNQKNSDIFNSLFFSVNFLLSFNPSIGLLGSKITAATKRSLAPHPAPLFSFVILSTNVVHNSTLIYLSFSFIMDLISRKNNYD